MSGMEQVFTFPCAGATLLGILHEPPSRRSGIGVLIVVGGPQYRVGSHRQFVSMARGLANAGLPVMRFDYRGMGDSDGETRSFETIDDDISAAIDAFVAARPGLDGIVLWGLCDAASAALMYCCRGDPRVQGLVLVNPWVHSPAAEAKSYLRHYYTRRLLQPSFWRKLLSLRVGVRASLGDFLRKLVTARQDNGSSRENTRSCNFIERMIEGLRSFRGPVLVLLSEHDLTARQFADLTASVREWRALIRHTRVTVEHLEGTDHTFSDRNGLENATDRSIGWLDRAMARESRLG